MPRLGYAVITRNRPMALIGALMSAYKLRGTDDVQFAVALDTDDVECCGVARRLAQDIPLVVSVETAPPSIGAKWNRLCEVLRSCDAVCLMTERFVPITNHWDIAVFSTLEAIPDRPFYWSTPTDVGSFAAPVVPRRWLEACDFRPLTERFHFWFTDTWLSEVQALVFGFPLAFTPAAFAGERRATMACRDVAFWVEYYAWLEWERLAEARRISERLGYVWSSPSALALRKIAHRIAFLRQNAASMEASVGDPTPPSERYLAMYEGAKAQMESAGAEAA